MTILAVKKSFFGFKRKNFLHPFVGEK